MGASAGVARPCALISRGSAPAGKPRPCTSRLLPQAAALAWAVQCGLDFMWRRPRCPQPQRRHGPLRAIQQEISSLKGAGQGGGAETGYCGFVDQAVTSAWMQSPQSSGLSLQLWGQLWEWGAGAPGGPAHDPPGLQLVRGPSRGWLGGLRPVASRPRSPAALQCVGAGRLRRRGGGAEAGAGFLLAVGSALSPPALCRPRPARRPAPSVRGTRPGLGDHWGGARRAGPGQVHTAVLCSGMGVLGPPKGADWLPWRPGGAWRGWRGAALSARLGPPFAESAAAVPAVWGMGRKGCSPSPGTSGRGCAGTRAEGALGLGRGGAAAGRGPGREHPALGSSVLPPSAREAGLVGGRGMPLRAPPPS